MWLWFLLLSGLVGYFIGKNSSNKLEKDLSDRNNQWFRFIASYKKNAKNKAEKNIIDVILNDIVSQGLISKKTFNENVSEEYLGNIVANDLEYEESLTPEVKDLEDPANLQVVAAKNVLKIKENQTQKNVNLDNASILLYLGAFLFVSSIGLFVAFSGLGGIFKTVSILLVALSMYLAGCWLFRNRTRFSQVGLAFAGIGMSIMPLVGLALYQYILNQSQPVLAWFFASLSSLSLYMHALFYFRKPFLNYLFIFTAISLFESSASIISAPLYYFGWVMSVSSIILLFISISKKIWPDFRQSALKSSQVLVPLALFSSLLLVQKSGALQLGVSLVIAGFFYGVLSVASSRDKSLYAIVSQILFIGATASLVFGITSNWLITAQLIITISFIQYIYALFKSKDNDFWSGFSWVLTIATIISSFMASGNKPTVLISILVSILISFSFWLKYKADDFYVASIFLITILALVIGQYLLTNSSVMVQSLLLIGSLLIQSSMYLFGTRRDLSKNWHDMAQAILIVSSVSTVIYGLMAVGIEALIIAYVVGFIILLVGLLDKNKFWAILSGFIFTIPIMSTVDEYNYFMVTTLVALIINIMLALKYRFEVNRWLGSLIWFVVPLALANDLIAGKFTLATYSLSYLVVTAGYLIARSIARGVISASSKVPVASFSRQASLSYVVGYIMASSISIITAMLYTNNKFILMAVTVVLICFVYILSLYIEKQKEILLMVPLFVQLLVWGIVRPEVGSPDSIIIYTVLSTTTALLSYIIGSAFLSKTEKTSNVINIASLATLFITPMSTLFLPVYWTMPVGFLIANIMLLKHWWDTSQTNREIFGGLILLSIYWLMWYFGVREFQAYAHALVGLMALYAYARNQIGDFDQSNIYVIFALGVATGPLAIQALSSSSGGIYGWWLILEQIFILILGVSINNKIMIKLGLFVSVAAVLYQLRGLGWAALAFLALFVISVAIYKINDNSKDS